MIPGQLVRLVQSSFCTSSTIGSLTDHIEETRQIDIVQIRIGQSA